MIMDFNQVPLFKTTKNSLKEVSRDDSDPENIQYLSDDERMVVDFDKVKTKYLNDECDHISEEFAKSVDALFHDTKKVYFVEFKNGEIDGIPLKVKDSLLIFNDLSRKNLDFSRESAEFILVINDKKYNSGNSMQKRARALARKGDTDYASYGLQHLRGYCFCRVDVLSKTLFNKWIKKITIIN